MVKSYLIGGQQADSSVHPSEIGGQPAKVQHQEPPLKHPYVLYVPPFMVFPFKFEITFLLRLNFPLIFLVFIII